jgi:hypothetical protein
MMPMPQNGQRYQRAPAFVDISCPEPGREAGKHGEEETGSPGAHLRARAWMPVSLSYISMHRKSPREPRSRTITCSTCSRPHIAAPLPRIVRVTNRENATTNKETERGESTQDDWQQGNECERSQRLSTTPDLSPNDLQVHNISRWQHPSR